jgi:hypothetical protein
VCVVRKKKGGEICEQTLNVIENKHIRPSLRHYIYHNNSLIHCREIRGARFGMENRRF